MAEEVVKFDFSKASPVVTAVEEVPEEAKKELSNGKGEE